MPPPGYLTWSGHRPFCLAPSIKVRSLRPRNHIVLVSSSKQASITTTTTSTSNMDSSSSYSSSLNTPLVPRHFVNEDSNSSLETHPPSPRFDDAMLSLDDTFEFTPTMMGPQAVPTNEVESGFPQNEEDEWSNQLLSQVLDLENMVEQRHQQQQQHQQRQQQEAASSSSSSSAAAASASSSKKRRKQQQQQQQEQECATAAKNTTSHNSSKNKKKKEGPNKENIKPSAPAPPPSSPPTTPPTGAARSQSQWPVARLFPTPPTRRQQASTSAAASSGTIEGVEPHQSTQVAQTQTTNHECPIRERSYVNITYELQAKRNLYETEPWRKVLSKARCDTSCRTYLVGDNLMLNHQMERNTLKVTGGWLNLKNTTENNIPFQQHELDVFLNKVVQQDSSQPPQINHTIGDPTAKIHIRMVSEDGILKIIRRWRTIEVDISTPQKFEDFRQDCIFALQVIEMLHERARQRRRLVDFLLRNPSPCDCVDGGAAHVHAYFYSPRVSDYAGILPLEFVYKSLSS